ncbi:MAG: DUF1684 domain-containing protein [Acidobacteria bacterium]|nr:DUF1684 domain-containing protein [Acidobacteriota bacterium]
MPRPHLAALSLCCLLLPLGASPDARAADYPAEIEAWRASRIERLTGPTGWLTLAGLHRLAAGEHTLGSAAQANIVLPASVPACLGILTVADDSVYLRVDPAATVSVDGEARTGLELAPNASGDTPIVEIGSVSFFVIRRGDLLLLRVRDSEHPDRAAFAGIDSFAIDPAWRFAARFEAYDPVKQIPIANIIGLVSDNPSWGAVVFEHEGETYRIDAVAEPGDEQLFLILGDATSGHETYGGGRYLYVDAPDADGRVDLDFNKTYNPPCAFTPYATCPLPPIQNRLDLRIEAGEKNYVGDH